MRPLGEQIVWLLVLAIPVACISRTIVFEEVFREPREWCVKRSERCRRWYERKFFYVFTCEYCLSHWLSLFFMLLTGFHMLLPDWRGYLIALFALVLVANAYLNLYSRLRVEIHKEKAQIEQLEKPAEKGDKGMTNDEIRMTNQ